MNFAGELISGMIGARAKQAAELDHITDSLADGRDNTDSSGLGVDNTDCDFVRDQAEMTSVVVSPEQQPCRYQINRAYRSHCLKPAVR